MATMTTIREENDHDELPGLHGQAGLLGVHQEWRTKIIKKALVGYPRILKIASAGTTSRNRKGNETLPNRRIKSWWEQVTGSRLRRRETRGRFVPLGEANSHDHQEDQDWT